MASSEWRTRLLLPKQGWQQLRAEETGLVLEDELPRITQEVCTF